MSEEYSEKELEDFLSEDKPIPGQNFVCLSFVSPEKILKRKEEYMFYHYLMGKLRFFNDQMNARITDMVDEADGSSIDISKVIKMKKSMAKLWKADDVEFDKFKENYDGFIYKDGDKIGNVFDEQNDFQTSVRGVKVRGVYNTKREADIRSKVLQRIDQSFDVFVGQVGYWLPWDPEASKIEDCSYLNEDLNRLMSENKTNEIKKDLFYAEQTRTRKQEAKSVSERLKQKLEAKKKAEAEDKELLEKSKIREKEENKFKPDKKRELNAEEMEEMLEADLDNLNTTEQESTPTSTTKEPTTATESTTNTSTTTTTEPTTPEGQNELEQSLTDADPWMQRKLHGTH